MNLPARTRSGLLACGLAACLGGCAQDPFPTATADNCILVCALVRAITGMDGSDHPAPAAKPARVPRIAHHVARLDIKRASHDVPVPPRSQILRTQPSRPPRPAPVPVQVPAPQEEGETSVQPQAQASPFGVLPPVHDNTVLLPGSVQIEENTSRFEPITTGMD